MRKYSILVAAAIASLTAFTSCDDNNDCGCDCNVPVIEKVEKLDAAGVNIAGNVEAGSYICIMGKNLGSVTKILFGDREATVKPAYRTDNTLVIQVPSVTKSCIGKLITESCAEGYDNNFLSVVIGTPTVFMAYNEFVPDGGKLRLKGSSFVGDSMQVDFISTTGSLITVKGSDIELKGNDGSEMWVTIPAGIAPSSPFVVRNQAEGKSSTAPFLFRDYRNMLIDFDTNTNKNYLTGAIAKATDGSYSIAGNAVIDWTGDVPANYSLLATNNFGVFHNADDWEGISFAPEAGDETFDDYVSVFGTFSESIAADPASASNYVVKFEVWCPKDYPTNYQVLSFGFTSATQAVADKVRPFCAGLQMSQITWDKSDVEAGWTFASAADFSTSDYSDGGDWMTVTIPMSEFMWNFEAKSYPTSAQNFTEGKVVDTDDEAYGDSEGHLSYEKYYQSRLTLEKMYDFFGGLQISYNPYDGPNNSSDVNKKAHFAIDNVRIVPNDGNGAIYPKLKFGAATQHYVTNPRIKSFQ